MEKLIEWMRSKGETVASWRVCTVASARSVGEHNWGQCAANWGDRFGLSGVQVGALEEQV